MVYLGWLIYLRNELLGIRMGIGPQDELGASVDTRPQGNDNFKERCK
jgi:hypothetical protein